MTHPPRGKPEAIDYGTEKRYQHGRVTVDVRLHEEHGRAMAAKEEHECLLDLLLASGKLSASYETKREPALRRYDAGLWLRLCFHKAGLTASGAANYQQKGAEFGADISSSMSDAEAWNRAALRDTMRDLGVHSKIVLAVCCHDEAPLAKQMDHLRKGLDRLADLRGI